MTNPYFQRPSSVTAGTTIRSDKYNSDLDTHESAFNALHDKLQHAVFLPETFSGNPNIPEQTVNDTFIYIDTSGNISLYPIATILEQFELVEQRYNQINAWQAQVAEDALEAQDSATLSQRFANEAEDVEVISGLYSAKHWAKHAEAQIPLLEAAAQAKVDEAQTKVVLAQSYANAAKNVEVEAGFYSAKHYALVAADQIPLVESAGQAKVTLAQSYANAAKNVEVETGFYSAKHYSLIAADQIPLVEAAGQAKVDAAQVKVDEAQTKVTLAQNYANAAKNVQVETGFYSAKHYSLVAADQLAIVEAAGQQKVDDAAAQASNAASSATKADNFANYAHNQLVPNSGGKYSSYHWAKEAEAYAQQTLNTVNGDFVPSTRTVNGKPLSQNIIIGTADIQGLSTVASSGSYDDLSDKPTTFTPSAHTHTLSDITDAGTAAASDVTDFVSSNVRKSLLDSPLCRLFLPNKIVDTLAGPLTWARTTTATYVDRYGVVRTAAIDEPREEKEGWLIEGASTNLLTYSKQFDNAAWSKFNSKVTADATTAPDGTSTAYKFIENATPDGTTHYMINSFTPTSGVTYTLSCFVKAAERSFVVLKFGGTSAFPSNIDTFFNLNSGTFSNNFPNIVTPNIKKLGDGWYRCSVTATAQSDAFTGAGITISLDNDRTYSGDGTSGLYIWGAQVEALPFASSYIPTTTAPATRAADRVSAQVQNNVPNTTSPQSVTWSSKSLGGDSPQVMWGAGNASTDYRSYYNLGYQVRYDFNAFTPEATTFSVGVDSTASKITSAMTFEIGSAKAYLNGLFIGSGTSASTNEDIFAAPLYFGSQNGAFPLYGHIRDFRIYDFALNADEVAFLSGGE